MDIRLLWTLRPPLPYRYGLPQGPEGARRGYVSHNIGRITLPRYPHARFRPTEG